MLINGINVKETYGAIMTDGYKYTPPEIDASFLKGVKTSFFKLLESETGVAKLYVPITFKGSDLADVTKKKSNFDALVYPTVEIELGDGFMYRAILISVGESEHIGKNTIRSNYEFNAIRHLQLYEVTGNVFFCDFTYPKVACDIEVIVGADSTNYKVGTVNFPNVKAGQKLEIDGINGRILVNGAPGAQYAEWVKFPVLVPGENSIECADTVTVRYYPTYM